MFDEGSTVEEDGKGTHGVNAVLSFVHYYINEYKPLNEKRIIAQSDNCVGQNKNKYVFWYYGYMLKRGLVKEVELHFLQVGHTKFSCDQYFGLLSKQFNQTDTTLPEDLQALGNSVSKSSALLYGQEGKTWSWFDWKTFLTGNFLDVPGLTKFFFYKVFLGTDGLVMIACQMTVDGVSQVHALSVAGKEFDGVPGPVSQEDFRPRELII